MKVKKKRGVEPPPKVRSFINSVVNTPFENVEVPLISFSWDFEKGDFYHWIDLINYFDTFLEKFVSSRSELQLNFQEPPPADEPVFPKEAVLQVLRVTRCILDNCVNKYTYNSVEHLTPLLASTDSEVVTEALQVLASFVRKQVPHNRGIRWGRDSALNGKLFSLSQGWGGKEEGLGLLACASNDGCDPEACRVGSCLHFEFYREGESSESNVSGLQVIHIENVDRHPAGELELLKKLVEEFKVPDNLKFSLLTRIRFARAFSSLDSRRQCVRIRLLAFTSLLQANPEHEDLAAFFVNEPEFVNELVSLLYHEDEVPEDIRNLALLALAAQAQDRPRQSNVLAVLTAGGNCGIIPTLVQKVIASLEGKVAGCSLSFVEALLSLVTVLVSSSSGCSALREAGLIPILLPLLKDTNRKHVHLVILGVHILEAFMDYSNPAGTLFRDLGGLDDTIERLKFEVSGFEGGGGGADRAASSKGKAPMSEEPPPSAEASIPYQHRILLKALLRAISLGTYAPGGNPRLHGSEESALPACLSTIFKHAKVFGGGVFALAASVMSDLIHRDPTCYLALERTGLPGAFLDAITSGVLPSSEAICCIPTSLDAICLNVVGLQAVKERDALRCFVKIFTSKMYLKSLGNDTPGSLASSLDELMRHVPPLRALGIDVCVEILKTIAAMGGATDADGPVPMDTDGNDDKAAAAEGDVAPDTTSGDSLLPEFINNAVRLLETVLQNVDTSRIFIDKGGIEALLRLYTLPELPVLFGGSGTAHNMSITFRAFPPQHGATLAKAVRLVLRDHLKTTLNLLASTSGVRIFDLDVAMRNKVLRSLSATECFLSLSAVLVKASTAMMAEMSSGDAEILADIGRVHREVLWQICLFGETKSESKKDAEDAAATGTASTSASSREAEDEPDAFIGPSSGGLALRSDWALFPSLRAGDILSRRSRRDHVASTAEALNQIAQLGRFGRLARGVTTHVEIDGNVEIPQGQEPSKRKLPDPQSVNYEVVTKLALAARNLYLALGKSMVFPSRRRDDGGTLSPAARAVASGVAKVFLENFNFSVEGAHAAVRCRYLGKVVDDIHAALFDSRRKTCNPLLVNRLVVHGAFQKLLATFEEVSGLIWTLGAGAMQAEPVKDGEAEVYTWPWGTLHSYVRLLEQLVTSSTLVTPGSSGVLLVQQVPDAPVPVPRDVDAFVQSLQIQTLNAVLPVWNHPSFPECNTTFITSVAGIIRQIYAGVGDVRSSRSGSGAVNARLGVPPDESLISTIVEMGFPRGRVEAALRHIETNNLEMAMDWLLSHPDEGNQEEDELARALALSLGNTDGDGETGSVPEVAEEQVSTPQMPEVDKMVSTCIKILQAKKDGVIFTLTDLLVTICNHAQDRPAVVMNLVHQLKRYHEEGSFLEQLQPIAHLVALVISEDSQFREPAAREGLVGVMLEILSLYNDFSADAPSWVTTLCLVLDQMLQYKPEAVPNTEGEEQESQSTFEAILGKPAGCMTDEQQEKALAVACRLLQAPLSALPLQAVLQLCARLTKVHNLAIHFLEAGGLNALLEIRRSNWFSGFEEVAGSIIRHLLEDPHTLQLAMESEIRHSYSLASSRHNGRVTPRVFLTALVNVMSRDPAVFMQAASNVCQVETIGGRLVVVLSKEDREKEKDKTSEKGKERERVGGGSKGHDGKSGKAHKKVPHSFSRVVDQLLEVILQYSGTGTKGDASVKEETGGPSTLMDIDSKREKPDSTGAAAKASFILKLMTEILLIYSSAVSVVLRRDVESNHGKGGLLYHVLHRILPEGVPQSEAADAVKLPERAAAFLRAVAIRSAEGRRRVLSEIVKALNLAATGNTQGAQPVIKRLHALVSLIISILLSATSSNPQTLGFSTEMSKAMVEAGMVKALTVSLQAIDLDHPDATKVVNSILRALEVLTRAGSVEQVSGGNGSNQKDGLLNEEQPGGSGNEQNPSNLLNEAGSQGLQQTIPQAQLNSEAMAEESRQEPQAATEVFMQEVRELQGGMVFRVDGAEEGDEEEEDDDEMEVDDGDEEEEEEEEEEEDVEGNEDVPAMSPPDTDVDDQDNSLSDEFEDMGDLDGSWQGDRVIEVRWTDGLTGLNHVQVVGQTGNRNPVDLHVETFQNMTMDDLFGTFRQGRGGDRSRAGGYRSLPPAALPRGSAFRHPLLLRPSSNAVQSSGSIRDSFVREVEAMLSAGAEGSRVFMSEADIFGNEQAAVDPVIFMGRRTSRGDYRMNSWADEGQQPSGSQAASLAQAVEGPFVSRLQSLASTSEQPAEQAAPEPAAAEPPAMSDTAAVVPAAEAQPVQDAPLGQSERSQDSGGSGATLGESLRSLEVEIGSADGREENDRQIQPERLAAEDALPPRGVESTSREAHMEVDEDMESTGVVSQQAASDATHMQPPGAQPQEADDHNRAEDASLDPRFLDALPEDVRAEVLASQQPQNQNPGGPSSLMPPPTGEIDPEFLAALPPEIQAEVIAQQQAQRILHSQQVEGVDMDSASIIATFPADLREEVLLTSPENVLAALSPALLAEAQILRERAMNQYRNPSFPRIAPRRSTAERGGSGASGGRRLGSSRVGGATKEPEGKPLVDEQALKSMVRLLRLAQPLAKGLLPRLLSNLSLHSVSRTLLLRLLLEILKPEAEGYSVMVSADGAPSQRLYGCQWNVVYARSQNSDGIPPLVSRRVLETLTHLARTVVPVAKSLLYLEPQNAPDKATDKGKERLEGDAEDLKGDIPVILLLKLLDRPLYSRSSAHLEQVLNLLEAVMSTADAEPEPADQSPGTNAVTGDGAPQPSEENVSSSSNATKLEAMVLSKLPKNGLCNMCRLLAQDGLSPAAYSRVPEVLKKISGVVPQHRQLFISELANAAHHLSVPAASELVKLGDADTAITSGSSSSGTAILRVFQALSGLAFPEEKTEKPDERVVDIIRELNMSMEPLWQQLSVCVGRIENRLSQSSSSTILGGLGAVTSPLPQGSQKVLDFVEAFFVLCERLRGTSNDAPSAETVPESPTTELYATVGTSSYKSKAEDRGGLSFIRFADKHRRLLNAFIRQNPSLLEKSFSLILKSPRLIDFDNKRAYFRSRIRQQHDQQHFGPLRISVRRAYVLEDSYNQLRMRTPEEVKGRLTVQFQGEEGIDAGGLTREWYQLLSRVIFDKGALLFTTVGNESTFQPNPNSVYQTEHLSYFKFVGRVVAKALFDGQLLDVYFTRSFYKHILGSKVTYHDIEAVDPDYYKSLKWLLENDVNDILGLTFSIDADEEKHILYEKTEVTDHELLPGGRNIRVTEENKHEYVDRVAEHRLTTAIRPQINAFLDGFNELIPRELISIFNDKELELLISGLPEIDMEDLRANTEYTGYSSGAPVVQWFWDVVQGFSKEDMARLLQFITGTSKVPLEGFKALQGISGPQKFQIHKAYGAPERLPSAHTCFNQLDLPEYSSKEQLHDRLLLAIHEASEGFGFG